MLLISDIHRYLDVSWRLLRPKTYALMLIYIGFGYSVSAYVQGQSLGVLLANYGIKILILFMALGCWYISGTGINDYMDYKIDAVNLANDLERPILQKLITRSRLLGLSMGCAAVGVLLILLVGNLRVAGLFVVVTCLNVLYSMPPVRISHRGILGPVLLPIGYIVLPVYSVYLITGASRSRVALTAMAGLYLHFFARILLKDFRDVVGDKKFGKKTVLSQLGQRWVCCLSAVVYIVSTAILFFCLGLQNIGYVMALGLGFGIFMLGVLIRLVVWSQQKVAISMFGRICTMIVCLVIFAVGSKAEGLSEMRVQVVATIIGVVFLISVSNFSVRSAGSA